MSAQCSSCGWLYLHLSTWLNTGCTWKELLRYIQIYSMGILYLCVVSYDQHVAYMHVIQQTSSSYLAHFHSLRHSFDDIMMLYIQETSQQKGTIFIQGNHQWYIDYCMTYIPKFCHTCKLIVQSNCILSTCKCNFCCQFFFYCSLLLYMQIWNHTFCLLMEAVVPFIVLTWMDVVSSGQ